MIKYSPKNTDISKFKNPNEVGYSSNLCRHVRPNSPYITPSYLAAYRTTTPGFGKWYAFLSSNTIGEIETMFSSGDYSFETIRSHGNTEALFHRASGDISEFYVYDTQGNVTLNIGRMLSPNAKVYNSSVGNGGRFLAPSPFTCLTMGINFIGGDDQEATRHSNNYFLFTVGDKDSDAEVKIHNPVLQAGDTVDLSDLTLTIQIPTTVE